LTKPIVEKRKRISKPGSILWKDHLLAVPATDINEHAGVDSGELKFRSTSPPASRNIMILVRHIKEPAPALSMAKAKPGHSRAYLMLQELFFYFKEVITDSINHLFEFRCSESQNLAGIF
jgi:hypothetical protein